MLVRVRKQFRGAMCICRDASGELSTLGGPPPAQYSVAGWRREGMSYESVRPACPGPHTCYSGPYNGRTREGEAILKADHGRETALYSGVLPLLAGVR